MRDSHRPTSVINLTRCASQVKSSECCIMISRSIILLVLLALFGVALGFAPMTQNTRGLNKVRNNFYYVTMYKYFCSTTQSLSVSALIVHDFGCVNDLSLKDETN